MYRSQTNLDTIAPRFWRGARLTAAFALPLAFASYAQPVLAADAVSVMPAQPKRNALSVAVVSATDESGDKDMAARALAAATDAVDTVPGFQAVPAKSVAKALEDLKLRGVRGPSIGSPLVSIDFVAIGKKVKAPRALDISVTPGTAADGSATYRAVAELYDTSVGGLVGRGEGSSTVTAAALPAAEAGKVDVAGLGQRSLFGAVRAAVAALNQTAQISGVVVSHPGSGYRTRISIGEMSGARQGARVEYISNGEPFAYGTLIELHTGESIATVAPESAYPFVILNTQVRLVRNPTSGQAGKSSTNFDEAEFRSFERKFALGLAIAGGWYYGIYRND